MQSKDLSVNYDTPRQHVIFFEYFLNIRPCTVSHDLQFVMIIIIIIIIIIVITDICCL